MNKEFISAYLIFLFFQINFCEAYGNVNKEEGIFYSKGSFYVKDKKEILSYKSDDLPKNYSLLNSLEKQNVLWEKIINTQQSFELNKWDDSFGLKRLLSVNRLKNSLHSWLFKSDSVTPMEKDDSNNGIKLFHTHGVVAKCNFQIDIKNETAFGNYTGWFNPKNNKLNIPCIIRLSLFGMGKNNFSPGVALKLLRESKTSINNHFMYKFEGFQDGEGNHFFKHLVRTEMPKISIVDNRNYFTKLYAMAKENVFNYILQRGLSGTVKTAEKFDGDIRLKTKYEFEKSELEPSGGVFHRPLHLNAGYPEINTPFFPRNLCLYSPLTERIDPNAVGTPWGTDMNSENFRVRLNLISKEIKDKKIPLYQVYVQHKYSPCTEEKGNPWCLNIENGKVKILDEKNVDIYGDIYLTSEFISSSWADSNLVFQHTF